MGMIGNIPKQKDTEKQVKLMQKPAIMKASIKMKKVVEKIQAIAKNEYSKEDKKKIIEILDKTYDDVINGNFLDDDIYALNTIAIHLKNEGIIDYYYFELIRDELPDGVKLIKTDPESKNKIPFGYTGNSFSYNCFC